MSGAAASESHGARLIAGLGAELWLDDQDVHATMEIQPRHLKPGTDRVRLGVLATVVDVIGGSPAYAILNPTVDLRVTLVDRVPSSGKVEFVCRPVRVGRRLFVAETLGHTGDESLPFMRGICTFVNRPLEGITHDGIFPAGTLGVDSYDALLDIREPSPGVYELDNHPVIGNPHSGTIQGGAQCLLAELVADRALERETGREHEVFDLDIRFLNGLGTPDVRARVDSLPGAFAERIVRVPMVEADAGERIVSLATLSCRPVP
jgi:acyl-coenzyme A thioesterase PaaI-like protein